jgi:hypothetical protein
LSRVHFRPAVGGRPPAVPYLNRLLSSEPRVVDRCTDGGGSDVDGEDEGPGHFARKF